MKCKRTIRIPDKDIISKFHIRLGAYQEYAGSILVQTHLLKSLAYSGPTPTALYHAWGITLNKWYILSQIDGVGDGHSETCGLCLYDAYKRRCVTGLEDDGDPCRFCPMQDIYYGCDTHLYTDYADEKTRENARLFLRELIRICSENYYVDHDAVA